MKRLILSILFSLPIVFFNQVFSQKSQYLGDRFSGTVSGIIIDGETNTPMEYVSVALLKKKDSTIVNGVLTNNKGSFKIEVTSPGMYVLKYSFVGYKNGFMDSVLVAPKKPDIDLGNVVLKTTSKNIDAVVVKGNAPIVEYKIDKKVVDVSSNLVAASGSVVDALQNTPSVQTDVEGNITLRGNSNFTVLIDGKPSPLSGSDALQQIPASTVQSVEIITNPSARYDAEGSAGIINVIMKKQKVSGFNGIVNATAGTGDKYSGNININYKVSKFNFTLGGDYNDMQFHGKRYQKNQKVFGIDSILNQTIDGDGNFKRIGGGIKGGIEYNINDNSSLSLTGNYGNRRNERNFTSQNLDQYSNSKTNISKDVFYLGTNKTKGDHKYYYNINLDYQLKLDNKGQQLSASAYFSQGPDNDITNLSQDTTNNLWKLKSDTSYSRQNTYQFSFENELRTKLDYSLPIGEKGKLDLGYQGKYTNSKAGYHFFQDSSGIVYEVIGRKDSLNFTDNIQAGYFSFSNSITLFDYQVGLRAEYENREINQLISGEDNKMKRLDFFPSIYLTRKLAWDLQLQASYTRRINRPRDWDLDPLPRNFSNREIRVGNPKLQPEFANSYELNLQKKLNEASFISLEAFLRQTNQLRQPKNDFDSTTGITTSTTINIDHDQSIGAELMLNLAPVKWFNFNASGSLYNYQMFGQTDSSGSKNSTNWNIRVNPSFKLIWGTSVQLNFNYNSPTITSDGTRSGFYNSSIGIRQDMLKHKGTLTLNIQNPFGITRYSSTSQSNNLSSSGYFQRESKVFMLTFSYRFNNYKVQQNKRSQDDTNGGDQEMNGPM